MKCEKWARSEDERLEMSKSTRRFRRLTAQTSMSTESRYPFVEGELFVLTLTAGTQGYHIDVDGRHITSFAYRVVSRNKLFLTLTYGLNIDLFL